VVSLALWALTGSVFSLLFALLGPVVALGGVVDGARGRRSSAHRDAERLRSAVERTTQRIDDAHDRERARLSGLVDAVGWDDASPLAVRLGTGDLPAVVQLSGELEEFPQLAVRAERVPDAPLLVDAERGVGIVGPPVLARAMARGLAVQLAARLPPETAVLAAPPGERWTTALPHEVVAQPGDAFVWRRAEGGDVTLAWAEGRDRLPPECATIVEAAARLHACGAAQAAAAAQRLSARAEASGRRPRTGGLPERVSLGEVLADAAGSIGDAGSTATGLAAAIGVGAAGAAVVDLVADGPHALVAGTTGSGKSELLISWVLSIAHGRSPREVTFVLIDFKGGAAFTPLAGLPHVLATLSDLDGRLTRRAIESLRAEVLRRERILAQHRARGIEQLDPGLLARLVIVVDEFAALIAADPDLHEVFTDIAARGRSLGLHLVLCTQRPSGVIRDAVLANIGLRISLRVADRSDSIAMLGDDSAARLPPTPRGRAVVTAGAGTRAVQVAVAGPRDATLVIRAAEAGSEGSFDGPAPRPWLDPLPPRLDLDVLPAAETGLAFGLADLPGEQRQPVAAHDPRAHGHLLVLGAAGAGATTLISTLAESARRTGVPVRVLSEDPAEAWAQLTDPPVGSPAGLLIVDGLDALLGRVDPDYRHELVERLTALLRDGGPGAPSLVVTARRLAGELGGLAGLFGSRVLLRLATREDHLLAGGGHGEWDPALPPGAGTWRGMTIQVAQTGGELPAPAVPARVEVTPATFSVLAVVAARPRAIAKALRAAGARVIELGRDTAPGSGDLHVETSPAPTVILGDPDAWLAEWSLLTTARREWPILLTGCAPADHRALLRARELPPLLGARPGECWLVTEGVTLRAVLRLPSSGTGTSDSVEESTENR
jgi:S-DNA-T family DNA segregation ATPase FtsK/SpoIIIE